MTEGNKVLPYCVFLICLLEKKQCNIHEVQNAHMSLYTGMYTSTDTQVLCVKSPSCWSQASIESLFVLLTLLVSTAIFHQQHPNHIICHETAQPSTTQAVFKQTEVKIRYTLLNVRCVTFLSILVHSQHFFVGYNFSISITGSKQ